MKQRILVNNKEIELGKQRINLTYQLNDIGNIKTRNSTFSQTLKIPKTSKNIETFEFLGVIGNKTRLPYKKIRCDYYENNINIINKGFLVINKITQDYYECNIFDGIIDLNEKIDGKTLKDLNYCDLNHVLNLQSFTQNMENKDGFIYALADFGEGNLLKAQVETQSPSLFIHTIFKKILQFADIHFTGDFFKIENNDFYNEVFTMAKGSELKNISKVTQNKGDINSNKITHSQIEGSYFYYENNLNFTGSLNNINVSNNEIKFNNDSVFELSLETIYSNNNTFLDIQILKNDEELIKIDFEEANTKTKFNKLLIDLKANDVLKFKVKAKSKRDNNINQYRINFNIKTEINFREVVQGNIVDFKNIVGDLSLKEILKDIMQRHGLMFRKTKTPNVYEFKQMDILLNDKKKAIDYTLNYNYLKSEKFQSKYAKKNKASFNYSNDDAIKSNDGFIYSNDENASEEKELFTSCFEIAELSLKRSQTPVYKVPLYSLKDNEIEIKETSYKIFKLKYNPNLEININVYYFDNVNEYTKTRYYYLSLDEVNQTYYLNQNYKAFESVIQNYKEVDLNLNFNSINYNSFDFFKLLYFRQLGRYYYANKLRNNGDINLIEVNEFLTNQPPSNIGTFEFTMSFGQLKKIKMFQLVNSGYSDPESDPPSQIEVKPINGGHTDLKLYNGNNLITTNQIFDVDDLNLDLKVLDQTTNENARVRSFDYRFSDTGSGQFSAMWGKVIINIEQHENIKPTADAGQDQFKTVPNFQNQFEYFVDGANSTDPDGQIVSYIWSIESKPTNSTASVTQSLTLPGQPPSTTASLKGDNILQNMGTYTLKLKVTDDLGLTNTDTVKIQISQQI